MARWFSACQAADPSDGLALRGRPTYRSGQRPSSKVSTSGRTNSHAPMLAGSSWKPDHVAGVGVGREYRTEVRVRERVELLDANDGHVGPGRAMFAGHDVDVDLAAAEDDAADVGRTLLRDQIVDDRAERALGQLASGRQRHRVTQQALRREHEQRQRVERSRRPCRRSRWKYWAAVVQLARRRFRSAAACRKRSGARARVLGALTLVACGRRKTSDGSCPTWLVPRSRTGRA